MYEQMRNLNVQMQVNTVSHYPNTKYSDNGKNQ